MPECPWDCYEKTFGSPNVDWCEASLCGWIREPANTWSNLAYIIAGLLFLCLYGKDKRGVLAGSVIIVMGVFSFIYHAGLNWAVQILDFLGMFLYCGLAITWDMERLRLFSKKSSYYLFYILLLAFSLLALFLMRYLGLKYQGIIGLYTLVILLLEAFLYSRAGKARRWVDYNDFAISFIFILFAFDASVADVSRYLCDPNNHVLQGHAVWHVLGSVSVFFLFRFYRQFQKEV